MKYTLSSKNATTFLTVVAVHCDVNAAQWRMCTKLGTYKLCQHEKISFANAYFVALAPMSVGGISQPAKQTFCPVQSNILLSAHFKYGQHTCTPSLNVSSTMYTYFIINVGFKSSLASSQPACLLWDLEKFTSFTAKSKGCKLANSDFCQVSWLDVRPCWT